MATHSNRATAFDGAEYFGMKPGEPGWGMIHESVARGYDVGQLQEWPLHLFLAGFVFRVGSRRERKRVERAGSGSQVPFREVQISAGGLQAGMTE